LTQSVRVTHDLSMTSSPGIHPNALNAAMAMARFGPNHVSVLAVIRWYTLDNPQAGPGAGATIGHEMLGDLTGLSETRVGDAVAELVGLGVLELVLPAAGSRAATYRIQPDVHRWAVRWRFDPGLVGYRVAEAAGVLVRGPDAGTTPPVVARKTRPISRFVARKTRPQNPPCALENQGTNETVVARKTRGQTLGADASSPYSLVLKPPPPTSSTSGDGADQEEEEVGCAEEPTCEPVLAAIARRTGRTLVGRPAAQLGELVAAAGTDRVMAATNRLDARMGPPVILATLARCLPAPLLTTAPVPGAEEGVAIERSDGMAMARDAMEKARRGGWGAMIDGDG
jgi:hypothetical protein